MSLAVTDTDQRSLEVHADGRVLFAYVYRPDTPLEESPKPYFHPLRTLGGAEVTLRRPHDHPWHSGLSMTCTSISEENFWGGHTYVHEKGYVPVPNYGTQRHTAWHEPRYGRASAHLTEDLAWETIRGEPWLEETRGIAVSVPAQENGWWSLQLSFSLKNISGKTLEFSSPTVKGRPQAGYGGLFWRGPRSFNRGEILAAGGQNGPDLMGRRAAWLAFCGRHDGTLTHSTLVLADHPENPRYPTKWFVRNEPYACASASFMFDETYALAPEATLALRYRLLVMDGVRTAQQIEQALNQETF